MTLTNEELNLIVAFEIGYKAHEKGHNLEEAKDSFIRLIRGKVRK